MKCDKCHGTGKITGTHLPTAAELAIQAHERHQAEHHAYLAHRDSLEHDWPTSHVEARPRIILEPKRPSPEDWTKAFARYEDYILAKSMCKVAESAAGLDLGKPGGDASAAVWFDTEKKGEITDVLRFGVPDAGSNGKTAEQRAAVLETTAPKVVDAQKYSGLAANDFAFINRRMKEIENGTAT